MTTIKDIAKIAGVSVATVSRVINNKSDVSAMMREKILTIMEEVGYVPNMMAKNLSHGRAKLIAVMLPTLNNQFFSELLTEIEKEASKHGYNTMHVLTGDDRAKVEYYLNSIKSNFVCGAIINSLAIEQSDLEGLEKTGTKVVTIDRSAHDHDFSSVNVDHIFGGQLAAKHLMQKGCRNVVLLTGASDDTISNLRLEGFRQYVAEHQLEVSVTLVESDLTSEGGYRCFKTFLEEKPSFDGVFCSNDAMAFGAIRACRDFDIIVPENVLMIGYDNSHINEYSVPRLSSIDQDVTQIGRESVNTLIELVNGIEIKRRVVITPMLVERESTIVA
ncbi:LacI family DNA-binding transcriptional regulator [Vibrio sp. 10N.261.51.F12]|uniref:LacI family DNA-binding transcriptional regulator n=1 Tax=Vibrio sp. 10N.261.51.F12 TaxID=3229679 RepID=UPI003550790F